MNVLDDDTIPTSNAEVLAQIAAALETIRLGVVQWGAATSTGRRRSINEDVWGHRGDVFTVADGMGGRGGGAVAARIATDRFLDAAVAVPRRATWHDIVAAVSDEVSRAGEAQAMARLGTTLLAAIIEGSIVTLVHLGDGRAYRYLRSPATQAAAGRSLAGAHSRSLQATVRRPTTSGGWSCSRRTTTCGPNSSLLVSMPGSTVSAAWRSTA